MDISKLERAIQYAMAGSYHFAKPMLKGIVLEDPYLDEAWFYLALCETEIPKKIECLLEVIRINPNNLDAIKLIKSINSDYKVTAIYSKKRGFPNTRDYYDVQSENDDKKNSGLDPGELDSDLIIEDEIQGEDINSAYAIVFSTTILANGYFFHYNDRPCCLQSLTVKETDSTPCDECEYFLPSECPLNIDDCLFTDVRSIFNVIEKFRTAKALRSLKAARIIHHELMLHGRPLHYSVITNIVMKRYPELKLSKQEIYEFMLSYPELIQRVDDGVYKAL